MFCSGFGGLGHVIIHTIQGSLYPRHLSKNSCLDSRQSSTVWTPSSNVLLTHESSSLAVSFKKNFYWLVRFSLIYDYRTDTFRFESHLYKKL